MGALAFPGSESAEIPPAQAWESRDAIRQEKLCQEEEGGESCFNASPQTPQTPSDIQAVILQGLTVAWNITSQSRYLCGSAGPHKVLHLFWGRIEDEHLREVGFFSVWVVWKWRLNAQVPCPYPWSNTLPTLFRLSYVALEITQLKKKMVCLIMN